MKKLFIITFFALTLSSCADMLNVDSKIDPTYTNAFKSEKDLEAITYQAHFLLKHALTESALQYNIGEKMDYTGKEIQNYLDFSPALYTNTNMNASWESHYNLIYMANLMLDNLHRTETVTEDRKNFHKAQALFIKGITYFDLARKWGDAVITTNSTTTTAYAKSPAKDVLEEAIKNATLAYGMIQKQENLKNMMGVPIKSKQFGSKGSTAALLAHAYAWKASMTELYSWKTALTPTQCRDSVVKYTTEIINGKTGNYGLENSPEELVTNSLRGTHGGAQAKEALFEFDTDYTYAEYPTCYIPGYTSKMIGYPVRYEITEEYGRMEFDLLENFCDPLLKNSTVRKMYKEGDARRQAFFYDFEGQAAKDSWITGDCAYPYKWRSEGKEVAPWGGFMAKTLESNYVYWRLADMILLRAETYEIVGRNNEAILDLNTIRSRANANTYPDADENDLKMAIFREREKELLMEGHRLFDVIRNKRYATELPSTSGRGYSSVTLNDIKEGAFYLPVHLYAFKNNTLMTQNRYWVKYTQL